MWNWKTLVQKETVLKWKIKKEGEIAKWGIKLANPERVGEGSPEASGELLSGRHLEEGRPSPLTSHLKQHLIERQLNSRSNRSSNSRVFEIKWISPIFYYYYYYFNVQVSEKARDKGSFQGSTPIFLVSPLDSEFLTVLKVENWAQ